MASATDVAAQYGYSVSFFNSDPELKSLLNKAVSGNWTPAQFVAKLQATAWFKKNGEAARQVFALKTSDPATYAQRLNTAKAQVQETAWAMGSSATSAQLAKLSENALAFGWSESQIKSALAPFVKAGELGVFTGGAAEAQRTVRDIFSAYGYEAGISKQEGSWVKGIMAGTLTAEQLRERLISYASSTYPALKDRLVAGETLEDIAAPYRDTYSKVLEVPAGSISLNDPLLRKAFGAKDAKGKPTTKTVWQLEQELRADPRWLKTQNAQDDLVGNTRKVLQDMGLVT